MKSKDIEEKKKELKRIYEKRFNRDFIFRNKMYKILCSHFFQKYIPKGSIVLDIGAGYCELINNIKAEKKIALDMNPDVMKFANPDVETIISQSKNLKKIKRESVDVIFVNNVFEHLTKEDITETIKEIEMTLKEGGKLLILQPNIRYCYKDYWSFFDHLTPLDDKSLCEALKINNFKIIESRPKFLPYTTKSRFSKFPVSFLKLYLNAPIISKIAQKIFGKQAFIYAAKNPINQSYIQ